MVEQRRASTSLAGIIFIFATFGLLALYPSGCGDDTTGGQLDSGDRLDANNQLDGWTGGRDARAEGAVVPDSARPGEGGADTASPPDGAKPGPDGGGGTSTVANFKVAFIGDQGLTSNSKAVLKLIKSEGAQMVLHAGDFDYTHSPDAWDKQINDLLGASFPYFGAVGNHDTAQWSGYQKKLKARLSRISGASCTGDLGVKSACTYKGLFFILSGVGTRGSGHLAFIKSELAAQKATWKVCAWHKNMRDMQVGSKGDEVGWPAYQACQQRGALIATGHEHSYSRTKTLTDLGNRSKGHGATGAPDKLQLGPGKTFVFVSGLAGKSKRSYSSRHDKDTWWATIYAGGHYVKNGGRVSSFNYTYGATFITFNVGGNPRRAQGYFKTIDGKTIDTFEITAP